MSHRPLAYRFGSLVFGALVLGATMAGGACGQTPAAAPADTTGRPGTRVQGSSTASSSTTAKPGTTTTPGPAWTRDEQAIIDGYLAAEKASSKADSIPDENDPGLAATHIDPMLAKRRNVFEAHRLKGWAARFPEPSIFSITPQRMEMIDKDNARLWVCDIDDGILYEKSTGRVVNDKVESVGWLVGMAHENGVWKLAERVEQTRESGAVGCAT